MGVIYSSYICRGMEKKMNRAVLLLGSNLGDKAKNISKAVSGIEKRAGKPAGSSSVYVSEPWGFDHESRFLNQVLVIWTLLPPYELLEVLLDIEKELGRTRSAEGYEARTIDIDILFYNDEVLESDRLKIPHPQLHKRRFTLVPLEEVLPELTHPILGKTIGQLLVECQDPLQVIKL
jgi:2-amino-4-hydroxy-6-hydroxymethyldihydropteridine diphosphokinase